MTGKYVQPHTSTDSNLNNYYKAEVGLPFHLQLLHNVTVNSRVCKRICRKMCRALERDTKHKKQTPVNNL